MDRNAFEYLKPTSGQLAQMTAIRSAAQMYAHVLETHLPDGPDKTYAIRKLREVAMWANVALTRHADGSPRTDGHGDKPEYPPDHPAPGDLGSVPL